MYIFILAGNSIGNRQWAYQLQRTLAPLADKVIVHEYAHWVSGEPFIDLDAEVTSLAAALPVAEEYIFVAKSMGAILAIKGTCQGTFKPALVITLGIPLQTVIEHHIPLADWLKVTNCRLLCIQNDHDPLGSFDQVQAYLQGIPADYQLHMLPGDTHDYIEFDGLKRITASELEK